MVEFYAGDYRAALDFASAGLAFAPSGTIRVRLLVEGEARALARLDRPAEARKALAAGANEIDGALRAERLTGAYSYSEAALEKSAGTTLLWLDEPKAALVHTRQALALHGPSNEPWKQVNPLLGRFDEAHAWARLGQPDRAAALGSSILAAGQQVRQGVTDSVLRKGWQLQQMRAPHAELSEVRDYTEQFRALVRRPALALQA